MSSQQQQQSRQHRRQQSAGLPYRAEVRCYLRATGSRAFIQVKFTPQPHTCSRCVSASSRSWLFLTIIKLRDTRPS